MAASSLSDGRYAHILRRLPATGVIMSTNYFQSVRAVRRKVFISYHHGGDQAYYDAFTRAFHDELQLVSDNSLDRRIDSSNADYVMRRIRENYLSGSSCTIVLCGADTWRRKYVDWEIKASLDQRMGLIGLWLPTLPLTNGGTDKPDRLQDNVTSGYAPWARWDDVTANHHALGRLIEQAIGQAQNLIDNSRALMVRNR